MAFGRGNKNITIMAIVGTDLNWVGDGVVVTVGLQPVNMRISGRGRTEGRGIKVGKEKNWSWVGDSIWNHF